MKKTLFFIALLLRVLLGSQFAYSWTLSEWRGVAEVYGGVSLLEADDSKPKPSDVCETCGGEGKLGDGTVFVDCPDCESGKEGSADSKEAIQSAGPNF